MNEKSGLPEKIGAIQLGPRELLGRSVDLRTLDDIGRFANLVIRTGWQPKDMDSPEKISIALIYGLELGLSPMTALQKIAVINNRPAIWGDAALACVEASGLLETIREVVEGKDRDRQGVCEVKRKGRNGTCKRMFSMFEAERAGLLGKGPWKQYPDRMLQMRARGFALRDMFSDVLCGLYLAEEEQDTPPMREINPLPPAPPRNPDKQIGREEAGMPESAVDRVAIQDKIDWAKDGGDQVLKVFPGDLPVSKAEPRRPPAPPKPPKPSKPLVIEAERDKQLDDSLPPDTEEEDNAFNELIATLDEYSDSQQHLNDWRRIFDAEIDALAPESRDQILKYYWRRLEKISAPS